jgi:hypothetical protein
LISAPFQPIYRCGERNRKRAVAAKTATERRLNSGTPPVKPSKGTIVTMPEDDPRIAQAQALLPAWFVPRMTTDDWSFAFLMVNGDIIHFTHIEAVHASADGIWLDIHLIQDKDLNPLALEGRQITAPTSRTTASVNARHVMMAFETNDT